MKYQLGDFPIGLKNNQIMRNVRIFAMEITNQEGFRDLPTSKKIELIENQLNSRYPDPSGISEYYAELIERVDRHGSNTEKVIEIGRRFTLPLIPSVEADDLFFSPDNYLPA